MKQAFFRLGKVALMAMMSAGQVIRCAMIAGGILAMSGQLDAQTHVRADLVIVPGILGQDAGKGGAAPLFDISLGARRHLLLDSGTEIGAEILLRAQRSNTLSYALAGCPPENDLCPSLPAAHGTRRAPVSPTTGLTTGIWPPRAEARIGVDVASVFVRTAFGEVAFGRDVGVAVRLDARAPSVLSVAGVTQGMLDPTGHAFARARNDPSGVAVKASFLTPRLVGLRAGISVTPGNAEAGVSGAHGAILNGLIEAAVSFSWRFDSGLRMRSAATYAGGSSAGDIGYHQYHAAGLGLEIEHKSWQYGARWLVSNNARPGGDQSYQAIEAGLAWQTDDWGIGIEASAASDGLLDAEGYLLALAVSRQIVEDRVSISGAITHGQLGFAQPNTGRVQQSHTGVFAELRFRFEHRR